MIKHRILSTCIALLMTAGAAQADSWQHRGYDHGHKHNKHSYGHYGRPVVIYKAPRVYYAPAPAHYNCPRRGFRSRPYGANYPAAYYSGNNANINGNIFYRFKYRQ